MSRSVTSLFAPVRLARAGLALALTAGCAPGPDASAPQRPPSAALDRLREEAPQARWIYDVRVDAELRELAIEAELDASDGLGVDRPAIEFVSDVERLDAGGWQPVPVEGRRFAAGGCEGGCRLRYRFALGEAAEVLRDAELAERWGPAVLSPPSAWLLRPAEADAPFAFRVRAPEGTDFVSGVWPDAQAPGAFRGEARELWRSPYSAFGRFRRRRLDVGGGVVEVAFVDAGSPVDEAEALRWIEISAKTVAAYFGRYPVPRVQLLVLPAPGSGINGKQLGGGGASIILTVGRAAGRPRFVRDWVAVHEMIHLAVPGMPRRHLWLTEGLATYVEPLARARRGELEVEQVWRDMIRGMPHGLPESGDRGIDNTPTWGRTYWGGALFALMADVAIRTRTDGAKSLDDALRAVVRAGGHNGVSWPIERFFAVGDRATGTDVLSSLYARWANEPVDVDLPALWAELGVSEEDDGVRFDDAAPLAAHRRAMTR